MRRFSVTVWLAVTFIGLGWLTNIPLAYHYAAIAQGNEKIAYVDNWKIYIAASDGTHTTCITCNLNLAEATAPSWSPDGRHIAFKMLSAMNSWSIAVVNVDGSNLRKIAGYDSGNPDISEDQPAWSPDGTKLVYTTYRGGQWGVFINNAEGSNEQRLSYNATWVILPSWSPDGKSIAFASHNGLVILSPDVPGTEPHIYANGNQVSSLAWSPNSARITFSTEEGVFIMGTDGTDLHRLVDFGYSLAWSPDGKSIAFISTPDANCRCKSLELIDPNGSNQRVLYRATGIVDAPAWSLDGQQLLFIVNSDMVNNSWYNSDVHVINSDGTSIRHLMKGWLPIWSPTQIRTRTPEIRFEYF